MGDVSVWDIFACPIGDVSVWDIFKKEDQKVDLNELFDPLFYHGNKFHSKLISAKFFYIFSGISIPNNPVPIFKTCPTQ